jgi:hypothetical protein
MEEFVFVSQEDSVDRSGILVELHSFGRKTVFFGFFGYFFGLFFYLQTSKLAE